MIHNTVYKVDFHTHSTLSQDGGITEEEYMRIIANRTLNVVAITDHNAIAFAQRLHKKLGDSIIVGEEIMTDSGEIIGLFLQKKIGPYQSLAKTFKQIHEQGGLVYIPHPFDKLRHGIGEKNLLEHLKEIDIIEGFNGRIIWRWQNSKAATFALSQNIVYGVGSDAHSILGIGRAYTIVDKKVTRANAKVLLVCAKRTEHYQPFFEYLRPKINKIRKTL